MRTSLVAVIVAVFGLSMIACGPGLKAPRAADGSKLAIYVVQDRNLPSDLEPEKLTQRTQMSEYFETDLKNLLTKYDYDVVPIATAEEFNPGPNKYLLAVKVLSYNAGSKGARVAGAIMGGWGGAIAGDAGSAKLAAEYKLSGEQGKIAGSDINLASSDPNWQVLCRNVNAAILKGTSKSLQKLYK